jgi:hypothetical protein
VQYSQQAGTSNVKTEAMPPAMGIASNHLSNLHNVPLYTTGYSGNSTTRESTNINFERETKSEGDSLDIRNLT